MTRQTDLNNIDLKIAELKKRKEQLRLRAADTLYKKLEMLCGEMFSPELIVGLVSEQLKTATDEQLKKWQSLGATFFRGPSPAKLVQTAAKNQANGRDKTAHDATHED